MGSGATSSAVREKKDEERCWESVVAMGVAWIILIKESEKTTDAVGYLVCCSIAFGMGTCAP